MEAILAALKDHGKEKFFEANKKALEVGAAYVK
jgi:2-oxoglutarate ferredoxin oxidoreductase subunit gamma